MRLLLLLFDLFEVMIGFAAIAAFVPIVLYLIVHEGGLDETSSPLVLE